MILDRDDLEVAYYVFSRFINGRIAAGKTVPAAVRPLFQRIDLMSATGHECDDVPGELGEELIGTEAAAHILKCAPRHVRRLANDLDGRVVAGRWVFTKCAVELYEESRSAHERSREGAGRRISRRAA